MLTNSRTALVSVLGLVLSARAVLAWQEPQKPAATPPPAPTPPVAALPAPTVEGIMDQAVKNISRRYNLNEEQMRFTDNLMKTRVTKFLNDHEKEVWPIIRELLAAGLRAPGDPETIKRVGKEARPLVKLAKEEIFNANAEWASILTPEQKQMHDFDLSQMDEQFAQLDRNLADWAEGKVNDPNFFPAPSMTERSPTRPPKPGPGIPVAGTNAPKDPPRAPDGTPDVGIFDTFVEKFIKDYEFDPGQIDSARSILAEYKGKAKDYCESKKDEFTQAYKGQQDAIEKADRDAVAAANEKHKKLLEPFHTLFSQMEVRLKGLLTSAQLDKYAKAHKKPGEPKVGTAATSGKPAAQPQPTDPGAAKPKEGGAAPANPPAPAPQPERGAPKEGEPKPAPTEPKPSTP